MGRAPSFFLGGWHNATTRSRKRSSTRPPAPTVGKPAAYCTPRVQQVGPEHFGIVCFDPAKTRSKFFLADFYGRVLIPPTRVDHNGPAYRPPAPGFDRRSPPTESGE
jgi:hypothetical protein